MKHIAHYITKLRRAFKWEYAVYAVILAVFLLNTKYLSYPDEFVNLLAGKFINMGKVPYREFFDHHLPFAWYSAAVLLWFSFGSFVKFRILYAVLTFLALFATALYIRRTKRDAYPFFLGFFFCILFSVFISGCIFLLQIRLQVFSFPFSFGFLLWKPIGRLFTTEHYW